MKGSDCGRRFGETMGRYLSKFMLQVNDVISGVFDCKIMNSNELFQF